MSHLLSFLFLYLINIFSFSTRPIALLAIDRNRKLLNLITNNTSITRIAFFYKHINNVSWFGR